jgi:hypothetical protein
MHIARKTASAIATLRNLTAVSIEYSVDEVCLATWVVLDEQDLVCAHAKPSVGKASDVLGLKKAGGKAPSAIEDHEIIPRALHFRKRYLHPGIIDDRRPAHAPLDGF